MKCFDADGTEFDLRQFKEGSLVVIRVTKPMSEAEWSRFCKSNTWVHGKFQERGIDVVWCPDWVEFKNWE